MGCRLSRLAIRLMMTVASVMRRLNQDVSLLLGDRRVIRYHLVIEHCVLLGHQIPGEILQEYYNEGDYDTRCTRCRWGPSRVFWLSVSRVVLVTS